MERANGIGGFFFRATDPQRLIDWYREHLGIATMDQAGTGGVWQQQAGPTVFAPFVEDTDYFGRPEHAFMLNFRVADLDAMLAQLRGAGVSVDDRVELLQGIGRFGWATDPEGNRIELWEPTDKAVVTQMRLVVEADDYDQAVHFFRDVLGLPEEMAFAGPDGAHVTILAAGRATLEIANPAQKRYIDGVEVGRQVAPKYRVAFEVADASATTTRLVDAGAELIAPPTETPWRSLNARLSAPAGLQITLFEELDEQ